MTTTTPGPTGPLPRGWHRVRWTQDGKERHVVTTDVSSAVALHSTLCVLQDKDPWTHVDAVHPIEHWQPAGHQH